MTGEIRSPLHRIRKQPAAVSDDSCTATPYVPIVPGTPGAPEVPAEPSPVRQAEVPAHHVVASEPFSGETYAPQATVPGHVVGGVVAPAPGHHAGSAAFTAPSDNLAVPAVPAHPVSLHHQTPAQPSAPLTDLAEPIAVAPQSPQVAPGVDEAPDSSCPHACACCCATEARAEPGGPLPDRSGSPAGVPDPSLDGRATDVSTPAGHVPMTPMVPAEPGSQAVPAPPIETQAGRLEPSPYAPVAPLPQRQSRLAEPAPQAPVVPPEPDKSFVKSVNPQPVTPEPRPVVATNSLAPPVPVPGDTGSPGANNNISAKLAVPQPPLPVQTTPGPAQPVPGPKKLGAVNSAAGGQLTFDENKYKQLTGVVNDMELSVVKDATSTPDMILDAEFPLQPGGSKGQHWPPATDLVNWGVGFGQSVTEQNEKLRSALSTFGIALIAAAEVFKDTDDLTTMDYTAFVTEFPDLNAGGGQINPGAGGYFGGGGPK